MLAYDPGDSLAHRLDPRTKLAVQAGFALAAAAHAAPRDLVVLTGVAGVALAAARLSPVAALREVRFVLPLLAAAPLLQGFVPGPPWFSLDEARGPAVAGYRVVLLLLVSVAYVRTTPARDSRAAVGRLVPGRPGQFLGAGTSFVFRFLPVLAADLGRIRDASRARLGTERPLHERMGLVGTAGIARALGRADRFALSLRARCFAWNPTLPALALGARDLPALALALLLAAWGVGGNAL